jgi:hypothetical protein
MSSTIKALETATRQELAALWEKAFKERPSRYTSPDFLRINLAYHYQSQRHGGLSRKTQDQLRKLYLTFKENPDYRPPASKPSVKAGTRLVRQWQGKTHSVTVKPDGYEYSGNHYPSLSAIARQITGTRWSGPKFFGLTQDSGNHG